MTDTAVTTTETATPETTTPETTTTTETTTTETATPANPDGMFLDGEAPRLGTAPIIPPAPMGGAGTQVASGGSGATTLPVVSPVLTAPGAPALTGEDRFAAQKRPVNDADLPTLPTLPTAAPSKPATTDDALETEEPDADAEPRHPMAHLMPSKSKPTQASIRAAEQRAIKKTKARKIKIGVAVLALAASALAGPPLLNWLSNAVNDAGRLTEAPAD